MPGYRTDRFPVSPLARNAGIQLADVTFGILFMIHANDVRRLDVGPLQVAVDVCAQTSDVGVPTAGTDTRRRSRVGGVFLG